MRQEVKIVFVEKKNRFELDEEMYIAFAIINESLYDKNADKKKVVRKSMNFKESTFIRFVVFV